MIENTDAGEEGIFEVLNGRIEDVIEGVCRWAVFIVSIYRKEENSLVGGYINYLNIINSQNINRKIMLDYAFNILF